MSTESPMPGNDPPVETDNADNSDSGTNILDAVRVLKTQVETIDSLVCKMDKQQHGDSIANALDKAAEAIKTISDSL